MSLFFNGVKTGRVFFNGVQTGRDFFNGTQVFTSEESIVPEWTLSGSGWTSTTWGAWSVGRDEGDLLTGVAEASIQTNGHRYLRITPTGEGFRTGRSRGAIRILVNGTQAFAMGSSATRTTPVEIDLGENAGTVTVRVELSADWGYTDAYCETSVLLHD